MIKTNTKNFWIAQCTGWGLMVLANFLVQWQGGIDLKMLLINAFLPFLIGFSITSLFRFWIKNIDWLDWSFAKMIGLIAVATVVQTLLLLGIFFPILGWFYDWGFEFKVLFYDWEFEAKVLFVNFMVLGTIFLTWNLLYFCVHYFNSWHYSEVEKWQLLAEIKDAELGSLRSQINPHFVFNAINNIRSLILEDPEKARDMLMNFSDLFRYSLAHSDHSTVLLKEELEVANQYLELLSIQFEEKLACKVEVEEGLLDKKIPPMMLQMLIENAVKHGISQRREGGRVEVYIQELNKQILIQVKNTGNLDSKNSIEESLGVGLENIKKRLSLIYNGQATFTMSEQVSLSEQNNMVVVSINIPLV